MLLERRYQIIMICVILMSLFFVWDTSLSIAKKKPVDINEKSQLMHKTKSFPAVRLRKRMRARKAMKDLDKKIPAMAQWYGLKDHQLKKMMERDSTLWVDESAKLFYMDEPVDETLAEGLTLDEALTSKEMPLPMDQTFKLHSRPSSDKTIYLDFDGHVIRGNSAWGRSLNQGADLNAPAFSLDGDSNTFNEDELTRIQYIWQRVAEDFAPFDVDVTTEAPDPDALLRTSLDDEEYGVRILISPISSYYGDAGGVSYLSIFNLVGDYYQPSLVFPERLAKGNEKFVAEAISHEAGHALGLRHDGTSVDSYYLGHDDWAPIMGGGYYKNIVHWSRGEYVDASNNEDDYQVILENGLTFMEDDHGDDDLDATLLSIDKEVVKDQGVIETPEDVDVFSFQSGEGQLLLNVEPGRRSPNLDIQLHLFDDQGKELTVVDTVDLKATMNVNVAAGTYYLHVEGVGSGDPMYGYSDYGSLGQYSIEGSIPNIVPNEPPVAMIGMGMNQGSAPLPVTFDASGSADSDGQIVSYQWEFGDGNSSGEISLQHVYSNSGSYIVSLTVVDDQGLSDTDFAEVNVVNTPPIVNIFASQVQGSAPMTVLFDASGSIDPDGQITFYLWDFDDGNISTELSPEHVFVGAGSYLVTLTVVDNQGLGNSATIDIEVSPAKPMANINVNQSQGSVPLAVMFDGSGSSDPDGQIVSYQWEFGDGNSSGEISPTHIYQSIGSFVTTLTVTDNQGLSDSVSVQIEAVNAKPIAKILATPVQGDAPLSVNFDASGSSDTNGSIVSYRWDFGDAHTASTEMETVNHVFAVAGDYTVTLTAVDDLGAEGQAEQVIKVMPPITTLISPDQLRAKQLYRGVRLKWNDRSNHEDGFYIERASKKKKGPFVRIATLTANTEYYFDSVKKGRYRYRVQAFNTKNNITSDYSEIIEVKVKPNKRMKKYRWLKRRLYWLRCQIRRF